MLIRARYDTRTEMLVEIMTDEGITGWGECYGPARMIKAVVDELAGMIIGSDALNSEFIWQDLYARLRDHGQKGLRRERRLAGGVGADKMRQERFFVSGNQRFSQIVSGGKEAEMPDQRFTLRRESREVIQAFIRYRRFHKYHFIDMARVFYRQRIGIPNTDIMGHQ